MTNALDPFAISSVIKIEKYDLSFLSIREKQYWIFFKTRIKPFPTVLLFVSFKV